MKKFVIDLLLSIILGGSILFPIVWLVFGVWFMQDYGRYLWVIRGPFPFSHMGSGPGMLMVTVVILLGSGTVAGLSVIAKKALFKT